MTCMKQEFCIHEKYCQRHIGQNFDSCILFSRNSKPMTNEEYLKSCNTEQLAEVLADVALWMHPFMKQKNRFELLKKQFYEWLKQPHTIKE